MVTMNEKDYKALEEKLNNPDKVIKCPRFGNEIIYEKYDVTAKPFPNEGNNIVWGNECFIDTEGNRPHYTLGQTALQIKKKLKNVPDWARYSIYVAWKKNMAVLLMFCCRKRKWCCKVHRPPSRK